jgi:hypothetical protein
MPGLLVGFTLSTVEESLISANLWSPTPYKVEIAKKVSDVEAKYNNLCNILKEYHPRKGNFFEVTLLVLEKFFRLMDGIELTLETVPETPREFMHSPVHENEPPIDFDEYEPPIDFDKDEAPIDFDEDEPPIDFDEETENGATSFSPRPVTPSLFRRTKDERKRRCPFILKRGKNADQECGKVCLAGEGEKYCKLHATSVSVAKIEGYSHVRQKTPRNLNNRCVYIFKNGHSKGLSCEGKGKEDYGGFCTIHRKKVVVDTL